MTFQLDTTGAVVSPAGTEFRLGRARHGALRWVSLSPFTQGYIEALFADLRAPSPWVRPKLTRAQRSLLADLLASGGTIDRRGTLSHPQWATAQRLEGLGLTKRSMFAATITAAGRAALTPDMEPCGCGALTHGGEAACISCGQTKAWAQPPGFSDLAPETLARIIADCEAMFPIHFGGATWTDDENRRAGQGAWACRSAGRSTFPPLTVQLGDDGKVRFAAMATGEA